MPRRSDLRQPEVVNTLVASAQNMQGFTDIRVPRSQNSSWQEALWGFYDTVGEFEYVANWVAGMLSQAKLQVVKSGQVITDGPAAAALAELFGSDVGKAECLANLGLHDTVAGEAYIVAHEGEWNVYAPQVMSRKNGRWAVNGVALDGKPLVIRTWNRHPRRIDEATSSSRSAIPILNEIHRATQHIEAQLISRLTSGGLLLLPNEMSFASSSNTDADSTTNDSKSDAFVRELVEVASAAINNRSDASATIPIVLTADGEHLDKPRLLEFWSEFDQNVQDARERAIQRLGLAMNVPPEVLTGTGDASHWQMWGVDEASIKSHAEPLLQRLCRDITKGFLWPALKGEVPDEELKLYSLSADTTLLRVRPNRSKEAIELWENGELSAEAMRRENGFTEDDAPTRVQRDEHLYRQVAKMAADAGMSAQALQHLGLNITAPAEATEGNAPQEGPSLEDHPDRTAVPSQGEMDDLAKDADRKAQEAALVAAAEQMVFRAMERGGNKAKSKLHFDAPEGVEPAEFYLFRATSDAEASFMLDGAFPQCERFASDLGVSPAWLRNTLETYSRDLIIKQLPHTRASLTAALTKVPTHA